MVVLEERSTAPFYVALGFYIACQIGVAIYAFTQKEAKVVKRASVNEGRWDSKMRQSDAEYTEHFSGGKGFGTIATFLTFFSTAYSGYTVSGIPQEASETGFFAMWWLSAQNVMNLFSLLWKPRIRRLSAARNWVAFQDPINDRFNNRLVSIIYVFCGAGGQVVYVIVQLFSLRTMVDTIVPAKDQFDSFALIWAMSFVILFAEIMGGMNAVVLTDSVQSTIMIISMVLVPIIATVHFNGVASSMAPDCANLEVLNCTEGTILFERGAACAGKIISNGCLGHPDVAPWLTLHPSVGMSEFFKPIWMTADGNPWPEYPCPNSTSMCPNPLPGSEVLESTRGVDGSWIYNFANFNYAGLILNFLSVGLMPNFVARYFIADSDESLKKASILQILIGGATATFPAIILGIMIGANLRNQYPVGASAFGMVVNDFNNRGGFNQFVSVLASVGATAAFMSTADSSIISITNMLSTELLLNWLFKAYPEYNTGTVMKIFAGICSTVTLVVATLVSLYDPEINDPEGLAYSHMGTWQNTMFGFCTVQIIAALFYPKTSGWAILGGVLSGWITYFVLFIGGWGTNVGTLSFTPFAENPKHILFHGYFWTFLVNLVVTTLLSLIDLEKFFPTPQCLHVDTTQHDPDGNALSYEQITKALENTGEIFKDRIGIGIIVFVTITIFICIPQWGESYDSCTYVSYMSWFYGDGSAVDGCAGPSLCGGIPCWIIPAMVLVPLNKLLIAFAFTRWKTDDSDDAANSLEDEPDLDFFDEFPSAPSLPYAARDGKSDRCNIATQTVKQPIITIPKIPDCPFCKKGLPVHLSV